MIGLEFSLVFLGFCVLFGVRRDWRDSGAIRFQFVPHRDRARPPVAKQRRSRGATETFAARPEAAPYLACEAARVALTRDCSLARRAAEGMVPPFRN